MNKKPKIAVVIVVYNGQEYIAYAIESILNQTYSHVELIVIDDGSNDESVNVINTYTDKRIQLICLKNNIGQTRILNKGLEISRGEYIARIDQDDIASTSRLEQQVEFLNTNEHICIVGSYNAIIDRNNRKIGYTKWPTSPEECAFELLIRVNPPVGHPMVMYRKEEIIKLGG